MVFKYPKVIESEEMLTVAGELLMSISQNESERAIFRSCRKFQTDYGSDMATARDNGRAEGLAEGRKEGRTRSNWARQEPVHGSQLSHPRICAHIPGLV